MFSLPDWCGMWLSEYLVGVFDQAVDDDRFGFSLGIKMIKNNGENIYLVCVANNFCYGCQLVRCFRVEFFDVVQADGSTNLFQVGSGNALGKSFFSECEHP